METRGFLAMKPGRVPGWKHVRSVHDLGMLRVPSGRLEASDPFVMLGSGLVFPIPPGTYPVRVTIADVSDTGDGSHLRESYLSIILHEGDPVVVENVRPEGVTVREQAAELTNGELWTERETLPDPGPGTAYTFQLLGVRVETEEGRALGAIAEVISTGAHPVYVVRGGRELLVPAAPGVVKRVDLEAGLMVVALPAGLEEL